MNLLTDKIPLLDHGYIKYIAHMGSDAGIVEAARMSTGKGFFGWYWDQDTYSDAFCEECHTHHLMETLPVDDDGCSICTNCWGIELIIFDHDENPPEPKLMGRQGTPRDFGLLNTLYRDGHHTPFEMGDICIEVYAPIMVYREWFRHRMQSYNEFSARYSQMPNVHYLPNLERFQKQSKTNKQGSAESIPEHEAVVYRALLENEQKAIYDNYEMLLKAGIAKEVARINTPVARYSKMRAKTDVRNWLAFMSLRMAMGAQWEIRQYANAVAAIVQQLFPKTYELFLEHNLLGERFSRNEMAIIRALLGSIDPVATEAITKSFTDDKSAKALVEKLRRDKEEIYRAGGVPGL